MRTKSLALNLVIAASMFLPFGSMHAQTAPQPMVWSFVFGVDYGVFINERAIGRTTARVTPVAYGQQSGGCSEFDFNGFPVGDIALLTRGDCEFWIKLQNAQAAGASGVLVANHSPGILSGSLLGHSFKIPGLIITKDIGDAFFLLAAANIQLTLQTQTLQPLTQPAPQ